MFGELSILLFFLFLFLWSVHGCMGMAVWVNVFTMPFLCADSGPWRKMSRAWPAMSAIMTSSGSTCPSYQESAWGGVEARQENVIVEVVRECIVAGKCWSMCWTLLQMFSVSTVLGKKAFDVGAVLRRICQASWPSPTTTLDRKMTSKRKHHVWWVEHFALVFLLFNFSFYRVCMDVWEWMCECMSLQRHSCAQTLDRGERCLGPDLQCPR